MISTKRLSVFVIVLVVLLTQFSCAIFGGGGNELPYFGFFIEKDKEYIELYTITGISSTGPRISGNPPIADENPPTIYAWEPDLINQKYLILLSSDYPGEFDFRIKPANDDILQLTPASSLEPGNYCFVQQDPMMMTVEFPGWCFTIASNNTTSDLNPTEEGEQSNADVQTPEMGEAENHIQFSDLKCPNGIMDMIKSGDYSNLFPENVIANCDFTWEVFDRVDFSGLTLYGVDFAKARIVKTNFVGSHIIHSRFGNLELDETDFSGATIESSWMPYLQYEGSFEDIFGGAVIEGCLLSLEDILEEQPPSIDLTSNHYWLGEYAGLAYWESENNILLWSKQRKSLYSLNFSDPKIISEVQNDIPNLGYIASLQLGLIANVTNTTIDIYDFSGEQKNLVLPEKVDFRNTGLRFSPSGKFLGWHNRDNDESTIVDIETGEVVLTLEVESPFLYYTEMAFAFSYDEQYLLTSSNDIAVITNILTGNEVDYFRTTGDIYDGGWSPDDKYIYTNTNSENIEIRETTTLEVISTIPTRSGELSWSPDGKYLLVVSRYDDSIKLYYAADGSFNLMYSFTLPIHVELASSINLSWRPDSGAFLVISDGNLLLFDLDMIDE